MGAIIASLRMGVSGCIHRVLAFEIHVVRHFIAVTSSMHKAAMETISSASAS